MFSINIIYARLVRTVQFADSIFFMAKTLSQQNICALGFDPGLAATGYAVVEALIKGGNLSDWGSIKTSSKKSLQLRLQEIYLEIDGLINKWSPSLLVIEDVYVLDKFPKAAIQLGEVVGVILLAAQNNMVETLRIRPTEVKNCLTGNGRASKINVSDSVKRIFSIKKDIKPDHASDAAALALVGLSRKGYFNF